MATTTITADAKHHDCACIRRGGYHCECWRRGQERAKRSGYSIDAQCGGQWCSHVREHEAWIAARRADPLGYLPADMRQTSILDKLFAWAKRAAS